MSWMMGSWKPHKSFVRRMAFQVHDEIPSGNHSSISGYLRWLDIRQRLLSKLLVLEPRLSRKTSCNRNREHFSAWAYASVDVILLVTHSKKGGVCPKKGPSVMYLHQHCGTAWRKGRDVCVYRYTQPLAGPREGRTLC